MFKPTAQQQAIVDAIQGSNKNVMVNAFAGCSKTTALTLAANAYPGQAGLALAFNVKIKNELQARFPSNFTISTMNGLGHSAWGRAIGKRCEVDEKKLGRLLTKISRAEGIELVDDQWADVKTLVTQAMAQGMVPSTFKHYPSLLSDEPFTWKELADGLWLTLSDNHLDLARAVLTASIREAFEGKISYDDQIYMSAMFNGVFTRYPFVAVDEAQDLSPLNHIQVKKSLMKEGRLLVVGDHLQAIYAFRGADSESMAKLRALRPLDSWLDLPLTLTFRCPRAVVARQQRHAKGFEAAPSNSEGQVIDKVFDTNSQEWGFADLREVACGLDLSDEASIAIICRNNAPLLKMAFSLIKQRIGPYMLGRDIGKGLVALSKKILPDDTTPTEQCFLLVKAWREGEISLARANEKEEKVAGINDRADCLEATLEGGGIANAGELRAALKALFDRKSGQVTLSSGHRAKGLEWDIVVHLDPWRIPSKFAREAESLGNSAPIKQERNLRYVIETRTKHVLTLANAENFQ